METGNPQFIEMRDDYFDMPKPKAKELPILQAAWERLFDEYLSVFGMSEGAMAVLKWEVKIALMKTDMILRKNWALNAAIRVEEKKLQAQLNDERKSTFEEVVAYLEQYQKKNIDPFKCSVKMYFTYVNLMNREAKAHKSKSIAKNIGKRG